MDLSLTTLENICRKQVASLSSVSWAEYKVARERLFIDVLPYIPINEPYLTDHGPAHIRNVFDNAYKLIGPEGCRRSKVHHANALTPTELYLLVLSILFHDSGNVFSRDNHNNRLDEAYKYARGADEKLNHERRILFAIVGAHGGKTIAGSYDTIAALSKTDVFRGEKVDCQKVAALLRFADELAEGQHRTSEFLKHFLGITTHSQIYHEYTTIATMNIGPQEGRIAVVYNIEICPSRWGNRYDRHKLEELIRFCYHRLDKLDKERKYNKHYCDLLNPFKKTEASFHFHCNGKDLNLGLEPFKLEDLVLPNDIGSNSIANASSPENLTQLIHAIETKADLNQKVNDI